MPNNPFNPIAAKARLRVNGHVMPSELVILPASVSVEAYDADGQGFYLIKVGTAAFEINVRVAARDAAKFSSILAT